MKPTCEQARADATAALQDACDCFGEFSRVHNPSRGCPVHGQHTFELPLNREARLAKWVTSVLEAHLSERSDGLAAFVVTGAVTVDGAPAVRFEWSTDYRHIGPEDARALAVALLRAADEVEQ